MGIRSKCFAGIATAIALAGCFRQDSRTVTISVPQMVEEADAKRIRQILDVYHGLGIIQQIEIDLSNRLVRVTYDTTMAAVKNLEYLIAYAGYDAGETAALHRPNHSTKVAP